VLDDEIADANDLLAHAPPAEVLAWAVRRFHPRLLMATAFGAEGCCIIDMLSRIEPTVTLINLDTGYQFPETLAVREQLRQKYGMEVELVKPTTTVSEYEKAHRGPLHQTHPDQCCHDRKVLPLRAAMERHAPLAWVSAIRKDQTTERGAGQEVRHHQGEPAAQLDEEGGVETHPESPGAVQRAARPGLPECGLLAVYAGGGGGRRRAERAVGGAGEEGVRPARARGERGERDLTDGPRPGP
jgi:3'-phosphoadenosine 5'-phosphosulfate sulfotransferase (PAPS reductase)/FAD synthetase